MNVQSSTDRFSPNSSSVEPSQLILEFEDLYLSFGGVQALCSVSCSLARGQILSVIGPNGAGKTCLLNCANGFYRPEKGNVYFNGQNITRLPTYRIAKLGIARTFQGIGLFAGLTTVENLMAARHIHLDPGIFSSAIYFGKEHRKEIQHREMVEDIIEFLEMQSVRNKTVGTLPYGLRKRVELGRALALEPEVLLLDEPMAGMNMEEKEDMARFILDMNEERNVSIALIEHDMEIVMEISDRVVCLDFGRKIAEGTPKEVQTNPAVIKAYLGEE